MSSLLTRKNYVKTSLSRLSHLRIRLHNLFRISRLHSLRVGVCYHPFSQLHHIPHWSLLPHAQPLQTPILYQNLTSQLHRLHCTCLSGSTIFCIGACSHTSIAADSNFVPQSDSSTIQTPLHLLTGLHPFHQWSPHPTHSRCRLHFCTSNPPKPHLCSKLCKIKYTGTLPCFCISIFANIVTQMFNNIHFCNSITISCISAGLYNYHQLNI